MKKMFFLVLALLAGTAQTQASDGCCNTECWSDCLGFDSVLSVDVGGGYRQDRLQWKTVPHTAPTSGTVIKEKWKDLSMGIVETNAQFLACEHYLLKFDFDYGWFDRNGHHTVKEIDLATGTLANDLKSRTKGNVYDISGGLGYQFNWDCYRYSFAPLVGYSYSYQKFKNHKFHNEITDTEFFAGNNYKYRWSGPWLGFITAYQATCDWQLYFSYEYHWARYRGTVHENFTGLVSQRQRSNNASGNEFIVGTTYKFCDDWFLGLKFDYKYFSHNRGKVREDIVDTVGSSSSDSGSNETRLRKLRWESYYVTVDIGYVF